MDYQVHHSAKSLSDLLDRQELTLLQIFLLNQARLLDRAQLLKLPKTLSEAHLQSKAGTFQFLQRRGSARFHTKNFWSMMILVYLHTNCSL